MEISQISGTLLFVASFIQLMLAFIYWFKGKSKATLHLGWAAFFGAIYLFSLGSFIFFEHNKLFWMKNCWFGALITPAHLTFVYYFTGRTKYIKLKSFLWYLAGVIIVLSAITTSYFTEGISSEHPFKDIRGPLDPLGRIYIAGNLAIGLFYLLKSYFQSTGFKKWQLKYFTLGIALHIGGAIIDGVVFPIFFHVPPNISGIVISFTAVSGSVLIIYAIFQRELFNIKTILIEILVGAIGLMLLIQALLSQIRSVKIFGLFTFFAFLLVGYLLIRVTQKEIKRKEEAERLAKELKHLSETLEDRVKQRTQELEKSYFEIKKRKDELEEFYNITVGRELKMVELKKEIKELKEKLGEKI